MRLRHPRPVHGETYACWWLRLHGWSITARNVRMRGGEIDIVAVRRGVVAFVEVKARRRSTGTTESVHTGQLHRVERAARRHLASSPDLRGLRPRLDVMLVTGRGPVRRVRHIPGVTAHDLGVWAGCDGG